jgi:glutamine amidotransferase
VTQGIDDATVGVVDVGLGNVGSILNMLARIGAPAVRVGTPDAARTLPRLALPGVGHFDAGRRRLRDSGIDEVVLEAVAAGRPVLGICLGMQLLTAGSDEGAEPGLGVFDTRCRRLDPVATDGQRLPVPHMGWNEVDLAPGFLDLPAESRRFYFAHSFAVPVDGSTVGTTSYGDRFASAIAAGSTIGVQFHPEKSHRFGIELLRAWVQAC